MQRQIWPEIHKAVASARIRYPTPYQTELRLGPDCYAMGLSTDQGDRFQGFHGRILVIIDEATGVAPDIWEAIEGIRAGGDVHVLALGNPTVPGGSFYDAFTKHRAGWRTFTISAFDTPNLRGITLDELLELTEQQLDQSERPYLVTRRWVREKYEEWGRSGAPQWRSRVLGEFPEQADDSLLSLAWLDRWQRQEARDQPDGLALEVGIDVAGPGKSETVVAVRQGWDLLAGEAWPHADARGHVAQFLSSFRSRISWIKYDQVGQGQFFGLHLEDLGYPVVGVNVGWRSGDPGRYANLKAELYWDLRTYAERGSLRGLSDEIAYSQLANLRYVLTPQGRIAMESKPAMAKRGVASPDRAEAIMLAYAALPLLPEDGVYIEYDEVHISPV